MRVLATDFDREVAICYALGEYQGITTANGAVFVACGDGRILITDSGQTHPKMDIYFQQVKAQ